MKRSIAIHRTLALAALAVALILPFSASARPGGHGGLERQVERLDLDDATQASVDQILDESRAQRREVGRRLRAAREQMHALLASAESDEAGLISQAEQIAGLELEMQKMRIATHLELRAVLTSEQMEAIALARAERHARPGRSIRK